MKIIVKMFLIWRWEPKLLLVRIFVVVAVVRKIILNRFSTGKILKFNKEVVWMLNYVHLACWLGMLKHSWLVWFCRFSVSVGNRRGVSNSNSNSIQLDSHVGFMWKVDWWPAIHVIVLATAAGCSAATGMWEHGNCLVFSFFKMFDVKCDEIWWLMIERDALNPMIFLFVHNLHISVVCGINIDVFHRIKRQPLGVSIC